MKNHDNPAYLSHKRRVDAHRKAQAILRQRAASPAAAMARVAAAAKAQAEAPLPRVPVEFRPVEVTPVTRVSIDPVYGRCTACGAVEAKLLEPSGTRDYSGIGESATYPTGFGCEFCS